MYLMRRHKAKQTDNGKKDAVSYLRKNKWCIIGTSISINEHFYSGD